MNDNFHPDDVLLARLVGEAGDPNVKPEEQYAEKLRTAILDRLPETMQKTETNPHLTSKRTRNMKRIAKLAAAATIFIALGIVVCWAVIGNGSGNIAFAQVAEALDRLRSATFDLLTEVKAQNGRPAVSMRGKGFFLAPSHQRMEISQDIDTSPAVKAAAEAARRTQTAKGKSSKDTVEAAAKAAAKATAKAMALMPKMKMNFVAITDGQKEKTLILNSMGTMGKTALLMDMHKIWEQRKKSAKSAQGPPPDLFEIVRRIVREGSTGMGEKVEGLGTKEIDGRQAVGFRVQAREMGVMTFWADPNTSWPIRIEIVWDMMDGVRLVVNNFLFNMDLDPSLFSLTPPKGYVIQTLNMEVPVEEDLLNTLRMIAENSKGR
ncbi:MAG: hypothetical protein ACWGMZ_12305, partial [Thermoguttaceae bacterium]